MSSTVDSSGTGGSSSSVSWTAKITLSYNSNGGSGTASSTSSSAQGASNMLSKSVSCPVSGTKPTRTGYNFASWGGYAAGGTYTATVTRSSYTQTSASVSKTLSAKWTEKSYSVSYNANGGSGAPASQSKKYFSDLTLSSTLPSKDGYVFTSWNTAADGSGTSYAAGGTYNKNAAVTLYAQYELATYTVSYNANEGSGAPASQTKTYGSDLTLSSNVPARTNYAFTSWNTAADGSGTSYNPGSTYSAEENVTLYAQWVEGYTVSFDANGGSGDIAAQTKYRDQSLALTSTQPTRPGYTFLYWNTDPNNAGVTYNPGGSYTGNAALKLYAIWSANTYTISFSPAAASKTVTFGQKIGDLPTVSKTGYTFSNWTYSGSVITKETLMTVAGNITLTASFRANTFTVSFNANGGVSDVSSLTVTYDDYFPELPTPTRDGYTFGGWSVNGSAIVEGSQVSITADSTATASWVAKTFTVTYKAGDGTGSDFTQTITYDQTWTANASNQFHKVGYYQDSWGSVSMGQTMNTWSDMTLTATYKLRTFTITFPGSGTKSVLYGSKLGPLPVPHSTGKGFVKWTVNGSDITYESVYSWDSNVSAVAVFMDLKYTSATLYVVDADNTSHAAVIGEADDDGSVTSGQVYVVEEL